ncbi:hypothetical protein [Helicobacter turcicus]|uniref:Transglycosylase SLT domain-containing protein n=1 Tax=Helicobacter turcicus TaxID=2867412 RepID=A0ABS7JKF3_9HELI|nr:hypothetical protein [Helicobacter turcicus]MBX7489878.1 hypothetical protein [Helicobacter turcicus]MBX7544738.1 hypothetical protein [Helicobacter turcicus]
MQRIVLSLFILCGVVFAVPKVEFKNACVPLAQFSKSQKEVLLRSYLAGESEGFGLTLAAIAWKESCAGEYKMNFQDPSAGNFHAYIPGVINRYPQLKQNGFTQNMVGAMLVEDDEFAAKIAILELKFWQREHKGDWKNIIKSYNKGYSWKKNTSANAQAEKYYQEVAWRVKELESYFKGKDVQHVALELPKAHKESQEVKAQKKQEDFYAYGEDFIAHDFKFLPIYQVGNEFAAPYMPKKTVLKDFELLEIY